MILNLAGRTILTHVILFISILQLRPVFHQSFVHTCVAHAEGPAAPAIDIFSLLVKCEKGKRPRPKACKGYIRPGWDAKFHHTHCIGNQNWTPGKACSIICGGPSLSYKMGRRGFILLWTLILIFWFGLIIALDFLLEILYESTTTTVRGY